MHDLVLIMDADVRQMGGDDIEAPCRPEEQVPAKPGSNLLCSSEPMDVSAGD